MLFMLADLCIILIEALCNMEKKFRTQWDDPLPYKDFDFPPSVVQSGMSPSISQMVRTRAVGGNVDAYEMDGIEEDAPFDSEYLDFFDLQDEIQATSKAVERETAQKSSQDVGVPPKNDGASLDSKDEKTE